MLVGGVLKLQDIFISEIDIKKVRHLHDIKIKMSENKRKHLMLTGKNGSGKTSVLEAIKAFLKVFEENNYYNLLMADERIEESNKAVKRIENNSTLNEANKKSQISSQQSFAETWKKINLKYGNNLEVHFNLGVNLVEKYNLGEFILDYFDSNRMTNVQIPHGVEKTNFSEKYTMEAKPSNMFLKYLVDLKTQQSFARNENDIDVVKKIDKWFNNFENSLRFLMDDETLKLKFDYKNYNFEILQSGKEPYGFDALSDGYSSVLNIIMDLIIRMESKKREIYDMQGIVIIDEIETHLHLGLQKKILPFLTEFFPNIQFIVSTHSPFVLNSLDDAVIYDLEKHIQVEDLSAYSLEGIVEGYFDIDQYSDEIKEKLSKYEKFVYKKDKSQEEKDEMMNLRLYLKDVSGKLAPELVYKFREIEIKRRGEKID